MSANNGKPAIIDLTQAEPVLGNPIVADNPLAATAVPVKAWDQVQDLSSHLTGPLRWDHPNAAHVKIINAAEGRVERTRSKVCIVGYAENSRHLAWWDDPDCEIWGVNQLYRFIPRADRWFQIHGDWNDQTKWVDGTNLAEWLADCPIPVYMIGADPAMPNSVTYPKARVMETLKVHDYFTSSIAFMVALAIAEGFTEIGIYGIDLIVGREYFYEKACVEFYLGIAHARGIEYHLPVGCALLWQSYCYGYDEEPNYGFFGLKKLQARAKQLHGQVQKQRDETHLMQGRIDEAEYVRKLLNKEAHAKMDEHIAELRSKLDGQLNTLFLHDGACQEVSRMHDILEVASRGGRVA